LRNVARSLTLVKQRELLRFLKAVEIDDRGDGEYPDASRARARERARELLETAGYTEGEDGPPEDLSTSRSLPRRRS